MKTAKKCVFRTRRDLFLDWRYTNTRPVGNHSLLEDKGYPLARLRNATVITIPNGAVSDLSVPSIPGGSLCPFCAAWLKQNMCGWTLFTYAAGAQRS